MSTKHEDLVAVEKNLMSLLAGTEIAEAEEKRVVETLASANPRLLARLCRVILNTRRQARAQLAESDTRGKAIEEELARLRQPPLYPADVLGVGEDGRLDAVCGGRRVIAAVDPKLKSTRIEPGDEVLLSHDLMAVVEKSRAPCSAGLVARVSDTLDGAVLLQTGAEEEIVAPCRPDLCKELQPGDRVLLRRDSHCVARKLPGNKRSPHLLEEPPEVGFDDIGGLAEMIREIRDVLDLYLDHGQVLERYGIRRAHGVTLVGAPGVGKTLVARAIAGYLGKSRDGTRFFNIKPGALRSIWYGHTETRIRELFAYARSAPGLSVLFFDELENLGVRGENVGQTADDRAMASLLAEINGLEPASNIFLIAATNRLDLCDSALLRSGRLGDAIYHVPRPNRHGAREIFAKYLPADLPYTRAEGTRPAREGIIDAAVAYLYTPQAGPGTLATLVLANAEKREVTAPCVVSGALIAATVERAKRAAALRRLRGEGEGGLDIEDLLSALDEALLAELEKLRSPQAARRTLDLPEVDQIVRVEIPAQRRPARHRYMRAA